MNGWIQAIQWSASWHASFVSVCFQLYRSPIIGRRSAIVRTTDGCVGLLLVDSDGARNGAHGKPTWSVSGSVPNPSFTIIGRHSIGIQSAFGRTNDGCVYQIDSTTSPALGSIVRDALNALPVATWQLATLVLMSAPTSVEAVLATGPVFGSVPNLPFCHHR